MTVLGPSYRVPDNRCPLCGHNLDGATGIDHDRRPKENDIGVCISCASVLVYGPELKLKICPEREWQTFECAGEIRTARAAVMQLDRRDMPNDR
jgi:hypothetical protein